MEEKRRDLDSTKQKAAIKRIVDELAKSHPSFYYMSTIELAAEVKNHIQSSGQLPQDEQKLLGSLSRHDIQIILSLHH